MIHTLRVTEIFFSLQGESKSSGRPTVFIRLTGCPLRCVYCDTAYAFSGGMQYTLEEILQQVRTYNCPYVCVTGGEPLVQPNCLALLRDLAEAGYHVSLETSGAIDVSGVDERISKVMDLKTPASGEMEKNLFTNIPLLGINDQIKFVIGGERDYQWAKSIVETHKLIDRVGEVLFSPVYESLAPAQLAQWILSDQMNVRMQIQLHKILWQDARGK
jgi:7-carboxy-7-deazaguanine synthase